MGITGPAIRGDVDAALAIMEVGDFKHDDATVREYIHAENDLTQAVARLSTVIRKLKNDQASAIFSKAKKAMIDTLLDEIQPLLGLSESIEEAASSAFGAEKIHVDGVDVYFDGDIDPTYAKRIAGNIVVAVRKEMGRGTNLGKVTQIEVTF